MLQALAALATTIGLGVLAYQTYILNEQLKVQEETANRGWIAELLRTIYSTTHTHIREESVKAYLSIKGRLEVRPNLSAAPLENMHLEGEKMDKANLSYARFDGSFIQGSSFVGAYMQGAYMIGSQAQGAHFNNANMSLARLFRADFTGSDMRGAILTGAWFSERDDATGAPVNAVTAKGVNFKDAQFSPDAYLCGVDFSGAKLADAKGLTRSKLACATVYNQTTLPPR